MFRSIKNKLIFLFLIAVLTPLLVMRLIAYPSAQKVIQETTIGNLQSIGSKKVSQVNDWLQKLKTTAEGIANNPLVAEAVNLTKADAGTVSKFLSHIPYDALFHRFMISDVSGNIRISADDKLIGLNIADIQGFNRARDGKTYISDIVSSDFCDSDEFGNRSGQLPAMYVFAPAKNEDGHVAGVMVFQADLSVLNSEMQEIHGDSYDAYIINQHGVMITESKFADQLKRIGLITTRTTMELAIVEPRTKKFTRSAELCLKGIGGFDTRGYTNYRGQKVLGVWYWIPEIKWGVITEISAEEVSLAMNNLKNPFSKIFSYLTITGVILAVVGIAFAFLIGQKLPDLLQD